MKKNQKNRKIRKMVDDRKYIAISCMLAESHSETDGCIRIFCFYV